jgi:hypothetical protein
MENKDQAEETAMSIGEGTRRKVYRNTLPYTMTDGKIQCYIYRLNTKE